ncbi:phage integrase SAM-like domain-containing protein [Ornithobacterium rhinotracheale]
MTYIKRKLNIRIEKRKKNGLVVDKNVPIFIRLTYNGSRINLFTGFRVDLKDWNESKELINPKIKLSTNESGEDVNIKLSEYKNSLHAFFINCEFNNIIPDKEDIKIAFQKIKNKDLSESKTCELSKVSFYEAFDIFIAEESMKNNWSIGTKNKFLALKNHLLSFKKKLKFEDLDEKGLSDFVVYFYKNDFKNVTTKKYLKNLKWFLRFAVRKGYTTNDDFEKFNPKITETDKKIIFLSEEEIESIKNLKIPNTKQYLNRVRDILLFTCYSGLRYSDVAKLKKSDVKANRIELMTKKTNDYLIIELNDTTREILKKYVDYDSDSTYALPVISNQKTNDYLKELGQLAQIDELITQYYYIGSQRFQMTKPKYEFFSTHIGRRTFICLCISKNIPIQVIMKWTGHSDYQTMKPYIDVVDATKEIQMQKLN